MSQPAFIFGSLHSFIICFNQNSHFNLLTPNQNDFNFHFVYFSLNGRICFWITQPRICIQGCVIQKQILPLRLRIHNSKTAEGGIKAWRKKWINKKNSAIFNFKEGVGRSISIEKKVTILLFKSLSFIMEVGSLIQDVCGQANTHHLLFTTCFLYYLLS